MRSHRRNRERRATRGEGLASARTAFGLLLLLGMRAPSPPGSHRSLARRVVIVATATWAAAWIAFAVASGASEGRGSWPYVALFLSGVVIVLVAILLWPRVGGVVAVCVAAGGALFFQHEAAWTLLAGPALVLGVASIATAPRATHVARPEIAPR